MIDLDEKAKLEAVYRKLLMVVATSSSLTDAARTAALNALQRIAAELGRTPEDIEEKQVSAAGRSEARPPAEDE